MCPTIVPLHDKTGPMEGYPQQNTARTGPGKVMEEVQTARVGYQERPPERHRNSEESKHEAVA